jgi:hypothetical protein
MLTLIHILQRVTSIFRQIENSAHIVKISSGQAAKLSMSIKDPEKILILLTGEGCMKRYLILVALSVVAALFTEAQARVSAGYSPDSRLVRGQGLHDCNHIKRNSRSNCFISSRYSSINNRTRTRRYPGGHICDVNCPAYFSRRPLKNSYGYNRGNGPAVTEVNKPDAIDTVDINKLNLDATLLRRIYFVTKEGIAERIFSESATDSGEYIEHNIGSGELVLSASPESASRLLTILNDDNTYKGYRTYSNGKTGQGIDVVPVVDRLLLQSDPKSAEKIAEENIRHIEKLLGLEGKKKSERMWYNSDYGTVTIIDMPQNIKKVKELMRNRL